MSLFSEWNLLLLEEYFPPAKAGQDVWIPTTRIELDGIGVHKGGSSGLIEAIKEGPDWIYGNDNIAIKAKKLVRQRLWPRERSRGYCDPGELSEIYKDTNAPTYLPYIALWVLAKSETEGSGFYSKVSELIGEQFPNNVRSDMEAVWIDLEHWSNCKQAGKFGKFRLNVLGVHRYIGMAYAQSMVTHKDIEGINRLFGSCRLQPGQSLGDAHFAELLEHGQNSHYLSLGLKSAMKDPNYSEHLRQLLTASLEFWDGQVPKNASCKDRIPNEKFEQKRAINDEVTLILQMNEYGGWDIGWRVPSVVTGLDYELKVGGGEATKAKLELTGTHISTINGVHQGKARQAINLSVKDHVEATLSYAGYDGELSERTFYINKELVRVLVWDEPDPSLCDSLLEREMPLTGPAYLLYSTEEYSNLELILINEEIQYQPVDNMPGLPDSWRLICLTATENISLMQRASITGEEPSAIGKARIRFSGGKPIIGAGSKKYAYYDLPIIELEADVGTELIAKGLFFEELENNVSKTVRVRRFKFSLVEGSGCIFKIKAKLDDEVLCTAGLQILGVGGIASAERAHFSIDRFGRPLANSLGLSGAIIGDEQVGTFDQAPNFFQEGDRIASSIDGIDIWDRIETNISCQFLDSLAMTIKGFMTYGVARDQIRRLARNIGIDDIEPALLIRELRSRGYVEIETDVKGHMVRICSIPPTLYSLPIKNSEHRQLYGVCGTLRLQQWKELTEDSELRVCIESSMSHSLPAVRIDFSARSVINTDASSVKFKVIDLPILALTQWLGSIDEIKESLTWYPEQGLLPNYLNKLHPVRGAFGATDCILVDPERKYELFKYEDQQIQGFNVYKLGRNLGKGTSNYSFIQDSRWGIWLAINAFAKFLTKPPYSLVDASPWPIHYESETGCLWMPARMEPPFVIERALSLCSGTGPIVYQVMNKSVGESILLLKTNQQVIGKISCVYSDMANGKWLCYRFVPRVIASKISCLLGGELKEMGLKIMSSEIEDKKCQLV